MYFYTTPQETKNNKRKLIKIAIALIAAFIIFKIGMKLGQHYENEPAEQKHIENLANEVNKLKNPELVEELKSFRRLHPHPTQNELNSFHEYFKERKNIPIKPIALPKSEPLKTTNGITINSPGVDYQSLSVAATSLKIGQFVMDANNCIYVVQNSDNILKVVPAFDLQGKQYCAAKN